MVRIFFLNFGTHVLFHKRGQFLFEVFFVISFGQNDPGLDGAPRIGGCPEVPGFDGFWF